MKKIDKKEVKELFQSGHINFLIGSGCSMNFLSTLGDIETKMNNESTREDAQKEYGALILKSRAILNPKSITDSSEKKEFKKTSTSYNDFLGFWADIIARRSLQIVCKEINIFTTNFDVFLESACEKLKIPYNDGFSGQIERVFSVSNFNKIQKYKSLQFDNTSDVPLFNLIKLHGSLSWKFSKEKIVYSDGSHISDNLVSLTGRPFVEEYEKIAVINPQAKKHLETVLDVNYASMLRKFALELEKENTVLCIFGFSLKDKHIKDLLYGAMKSNPTLVVIYFSFSKYDEKLDSLNESENPNFYVVSEGSSFDLKKNTKYLRQVFNGSQA